MTVRIETEKITFRLIEDGIKVAIFLDRPVEDGYSSLDSQGTPGVFPTSLLRELPEVNGQYLLKPGESFYKVI